MKNKKKDEKTDSLQSEKMSSTSSVLNRVPSAGTGSRNNEPRAERNNESRAEKKSSANRSRMAKAMLMRSSGTPTTGPLSNRASTEYTAQSTALVEAVLAGAPADL